jgi:hypothetical protein
MDRLCFGTFAKTLQGAMQKPNNNQAVVALLLDFITEEASGNELSADFSIKAKTVSGLINCNESVHEDIIALSSKQKVINAVSKKFANRVPLSPVLVFDLIENISNLINADTTISTATRDELTAIASKEHLAEFLSSVYLYALNKPNKQTVNKTDTEAAEEITTMDDIARLNAIYAKYPRPKELDVPSEPAHDELEYIAQLLAAYAESEGISELTRLELEVYPTYNNDLRQRRKEYYAAESVRRGTREVFKENDTDQFDLLKEEMYDGIFDVHSQDYKDGYQRLLRVMTQVSSIQINKSSISKLPEWMGNKERKGVCHILVNDGRITWVVRDG